MAIFYAFGDVEPKLIDAINSVGARVGTRPSTKVLSIGTLIAVGRVEVLVGIGWAATLDAVNDEPVLWILDLRRIGFVCDADLTRATAVDSCVHSIAAVKGKKL